MTPIRLAALCALIASPALANPAEDFTRLTAAFPGLSFDRSPEIMVKGTETMIIGLTGRWVQASTLMGGSAYFPAPELLKQACERQGWKITPEGRLGLSLTLETKHGPATVKMQYVGGTSFQSSFDEAAFRRWLFGDKAEEMDANVIYNSVVQNPWNGRFSLIPSGDDLLLLLPEGGPAELWARCP